MSTTNDTDEMEDLTQQAEESGGDAPEQETTDQGQQDPEGELREALEKEKDKFLRLFAEFENYKKRTTRERLDLFKTAGQELMTALLPVLDDFDRAVRELERAGEDELLKGVVLIHNKFRDTLRAKGLEPIEAREGDAFDADLHEAVTQVPAPKKSLKGKVIDVIEKGYKLGDRVIRHPKVVVGN
jgi:molecular chaperone GrpE